MNEIREFDPSDRLIEIAEEFAQCVRHGESPSVDDFANRYPDEAAEIHRYLPLLLAMDKQTADADGDSDTSQSNLTLPIPADQLPVGISRYFIRRLLGVGNMGAVYEAQDLELDRTVALKMPQLQQVNRRAVERFYREARAMATVDHPNICSIYDVGEIQPEDVDVDALQDIVGRPYLTMAFVEGSVLSESMAGRIWTPAEAAQLVIKVASALDVAHAAGVVHRDIKPGNIVIDAQGEPILMDFGLARRDLPEETEITIDGQIIGSPAYMSPEQINCRRKVGPPTDIYSLGIVLYELVCGKRPFTGSRLTLLRDVCWSPPPNPREVRSDVDAVMASICLKAIAKNPSDRYATAGDFAKDLKAYLAGRPATELIAGPGPVVGGRKWSVNWPVVTGIVVCVAVAVLLTWPLWGSRMQLSANRPSTGPVNGNAQTPSIISVEQIRAPLHQLFYNHFRFRRHKTREPDMSAAYGEFFARYGITRDETSAKDLQRMLSLQVSETQTEILVALESWLLCLTRESEDVPVPWLRSLLEFNHADHTPVRNAVLELDSARLSVLLHQFAIDHYDPRLPVIWSLYLRRPDRENAKLFLTRARDAYPNDLWVKAAFGLRQQDNTNNAGAAESFRAALEIEESTELLTHLGMCLLRQKKRDEAMAALGRAVDLDPAYGMAQLFLGKALFLEGDIGAAESTLRAAIDNKCSYMGQAQHYYALTLVRLERGDEAQEAANAALALFRENENWRNAMVFARNMLRELEKLDEPSPVVFRFRLVNEHHLAGVKLAAKPGVKLMVKRSQISAIGPYAKRVLRDLEGVEPPDSWRIKRLRNVIANANKLRKRQR